MDVVFKPQFEAWRIKARALLARGETPGEVNWLEDGGEPAGLFDRLDAESNAQQTKPVRPNVPAAFMQLAERAAAHCNPERWRVLYRLLWRLVYEDKHLLSLASDDDVREVRRMADQVGRDVHKMHAFVRFRQQPDGSYAAWHVPDHHIVRLAVPFFKRRFPTMRWTIFTPDETASWDGQKLRYLPGCDAASAPQTPDDLEALWKTYYGATFNPARIKIGMMKREMPVRHWATLPETSIINDLLAAAPERLAAMAAAQPASASVHVPASLDLSVLSRAAKDCRGCRICITATQTVFGQGPSDARLVIVGEQPGDEEDRRGEPFVGPAGRLLDDALVAAGIDRRTVYLTNAVKHFKFESNGKVRIHKRADAQEVAACRPWLEAELAAIKPQILVCMGVTAAQAIFGRAIKMRDERGRWQASRYTPHTLITLHPAAVLRAGDADQQTESYAQLVADLTSVVGVLLATQPN